MMHRPLDKYFDAARQSSSLVSPDEARDLVAGNSAASTTSTTTGGFITTALPTLLVVVALTSTLLYFGTSGIENEEGGMEKAEMVVAGEQDLRADHDGAGLDRSGALVRDTDLIATDATPRHRQDRPVITNSTTPERPEQPTPFAASIVPVRTESDDVVDDVLTVAALRTDEPSLANPTITDPRTTRNQRLRVVADVTSLPEGRLLDGSILISKLDELNGPGSHDYNLVVSGDGSRRIFASDNVNGLGGHDLWEASIGPDGRSSAPVNLGSGINGADHEGGVAISADGTRIFYTSCGDRSDGLGDCDIYEARRSDDGWETIGNVGALNSRDWDGNPTLSPDGNTIYFVSNRRGSIGNSKDIWVSHRDAGGSWSTPKNLGATVNTDEIEDAPCLAADGATLYFSSNGHDGRGGLDFFSAPIGAGVSPGEPRNLGDRINTPRDEIFLSFGAEPGLFYFARAEDDDDFDLFQAIEEPHPVETFLSGRLRGIERFDYIRADLFLVDPVTDEVVARTELDRDGTFRFRFTEIVPRPARPLELRSDRFATDIASQSHPIQTMITLAATAIRTDYRCDLRIVEE